MVVCSAGRDEAGFADEDDGLGAVADVELARMRPTWVLLVCSAMTRCR
jgi:hypothetical protein